jgi:signal transduction histidine kinase
MQPGFEADSSRLLTGAELITRLSQPADPATAPGDGSGHEELLVMVAGWEDGFPACAPFVAADGGEDCRSCPMAVASEVLRTGRAASDRCASGIRLLAFPAPAGSRSAVGVLRLGAEGAGDELPSGTAVLRAARRLRNHDGLLAWQAEQRARGADRRRTAAAALAQMIATTEEFHRLYTTASRDRASVEQAATRLDTLARATLRESERARTQVAHELHDTAAQSMVSAHRFMEAARASLNGAHPEAAPRHLDAAQERLLTAIREIRVVLNRLVPPGLEELGVASALRIHVRDNVPETITVAVQGELPRAEGWLEADLFAMTVEAVGNAVHHAACTRIQISLRASRERGIITVTDNGIGFDPTAARRRTQEGMGLMGMTRRAIWLGGRVDVTSRPGETAIRIAAPLVEPEGTGEEDIAALGAREEP